MNKKDIRILGTGSYLPKKKMTHSELEKNLKLESGWIQDHCGVLTRYFAEDEESSHMGAEAAKQALEDANLTTENIDAIIGVSGVPQQAIPSMGALLHKKLGLKKSPAFDVNSTCLSFLSGLDIASELIQSEKFNNVLLVSSDIASVGLNPKDPKTATLFGDGAAAVVIGPSGRTSSHIKTTMFETWTEEQESCVFEDGGTKLHLKKLSKKDHYKHYFRMDGPRLFKIAIPRAFKMMKELLHESQVSQEDLSLIIPHQASPGALRLFEKKLSGLSCKVLNIVQNFGNMIATSIPFALNYAIKRGLLNRGDTCMLLGTSAGISIGGVVLEY